MKVEQYVTSNGYNTKQSIEIDGKAVTIRHGFDSLAMNVIELEALNELLIRTLENKQLILLLRKQINDYLLRLTRLKIDRIRQKLQNKIVELEIEISSLGGNRIKHHWE